MYKTVRKSLMATLAIGAICTASCSKSSDDSTTGPVKEDPNFMISYSTKEGTFMVGIQDLMNGTISPVGKGTDVTIYIL